MFSNLVEYNYVNFPWPEQIIHLDFSPKRQINLYRIMFLDNIFPPDVDKVVYRDADQCNLDTTDLRLLMQTDMEGMP